MSETWVSQPAWTRRPDERRRSHLLVNERQQAQITQLTSEVQTTQSALAGFARTVLVRLGTDSAREVEDVLADAYLAAVTRLRNDPTLQVQNMAGWLRRIILFTCMERRRRDGRDHRRFLAQVQEEDDALDLLAGQHPAFDLRIALREALERLPEDDQTIVTMSAKGYTSDEIAESVGRTAEAVRQQKSRVLATLQKMLGGIQIWAK